LAKYRHPQVINCATDWDQALLDTIPLAAAATSAEELSQSLSEMFTPAGGLNTSGDISVAPDWIKTAAITDTLKAELAGLAEVRPAEQCYVGFSSIQVPGFSGDIGFNNNPEFPNEQQRLLALFRLWGAIEYYFPYKDIIGRKWSDILYEALPSVIEADSEQSFHKALAHFNNQINDGHSYYVSAAYPLNVYPWLPLTAQTINGKSIVTKVLAEAAPIRPGDEITAIDGIDIEQLKLAREEDTHGSNPVSRDYWLHNLLLSRSSNVSTLLNFRRLDGTTGSVRLNTSSVYRARLAASSGEIWRTERPANSCTIGVVDMARLEPEQIDDMLKDFKSVDGIVFDLRNYPNGTAWQLVERLFPEPLLVAEFATPERRSPGDYDRRRVTIGNLSLNPFEGRILILVNEITLSQAEYSAMLLQAGGNAITVGSQTQGADGNITSVELPQQSSAYFTSLGVYYPDGRETQRIGIVPDIHVALDRTSLIEGRDKVLETALNCDLMTADIPYRAVRSGIFFDPTRNGEGLDVHLTAEQAVVVDFAFTETGEPSWQLGVGPRQRGESSIDLQEYTYLSEGETQYQFGHTINLDYHRGPYDPVCAIADQERITESVRVDTLIDAQKKRVCFEPILEPKPAENQLNISGSWYAGEADGGWGLSLQQRGDVLVNTAYLYDGDGQPRWVLGTAKITDESAITMKMSQVTGYCRTCEPVPIVFEDAGTLTLLPTISTDGTTTLQLTMDVQYSGNAPRQWQRDNIELRRLTPALPVDN
jgi:C-terminal processing protease CtpA/Prc